MSAITVNEAVALLSRIAKQHGDDVLVVNYDPGHVTMGPSPATEVTGITAGFDWNHGRVSLQTAKELGVTGGDLMRLRRHLSDAQESLYFVRRTLDDKRWTAERKLELIAEAVERK